MPKLRHTVLICTGAGRSSCQLQAQQSTRTSIHLLPQDLTKGLRTAAQCVSNRVCQTGPQAPYKHRWLLKSPTAAQGFAIVRALAQLLSTCRRPCQPGPPAPCRCRWLHSRSPAALNMLCRTTTSQPPIPKRYLMCAKHIVSRAPQILAGSRCFGCYSSSLRMPLATKLLSNCSVHAEDLVGEALQLLAGVSDRLDCGGALLVQLLRC